MSNETTCDACNAGRLLVALETLEAVYPLRERPHERPPRFSFCADRPGCREVSEKWEAEILPKLRQPSEVSFGEWRGEDPADLLDYLPLTSEIASSWLQWVKEMEREPELFEFVGQALRALLQGGGPEAGPDGLSQADAPAANAIAVAVELGLCVVPPPRA